MRHSALRPVIWLALMTVTAACSDDSSTNDNASTTDEGGSGAGGRTSTTTAGRTSSSTAGRGGSTATAGRTSTSNGGTGGSTTGTTTAGRGGSSAVAGRGGSTANTSNGGSGGATTSSNAGSGGQAAQALSDAEIVAILTAANNGEVQQGNVAVTKAVAPAVRTFAQDMVSMHTAAQTRLNGVITAENLTPAESTTSTDLTKTSSNIVSKLQAADLDAFDMLYIQTQIDVHRTVLTALDEQLIPAAKNAAVRTELTATRAVVVEHLNRARAIAVTLDLGVDAGAEADAGI